MAFKHANLSVIAYANGFTMWHYTTEDSLQDVLSGYFDPVSHLMNKNDMIILNLCDMNCMMFIKSIEPNKTVKLG